MRSRSSFSCDSLWDGDDIALCWQDLVIAPCLSFLVVCVCLRRLHALWAVDQQIRSVMLQVPGLSSLTTPTGQVRSAVRTFNLVVSVALLAVNLALVGLDIKHARDRHKPNIMLVGDGCNVLSWLTITLTLAKEAPLNRAPTVSVRVCWLLLFVAATLRLRVDINMLIDYEQCGCTDPLHLILVRLGRFVLTLALATVALTQRPTSPLARHRLSRPTSSRTHSFLSVEDGGTHGGKGLRESLLGNGRDVYSASSFMDRLTLGWVFPILDLARSRRLQRGDVFPLSPSDAPAVEAEHLKSHWAHWRAHTRAADAGAACGCCACCAECEAGRARGEGLAVQSWGWSLLRAVVAVHKGKLSLALLVGLLAVLGELMFPILLSRIIPCVDGHCNRSTRVLYALGLPLAVGSVVAARAQQLWLVGRVCAVVVGAVDMMVLEGVEGRQLRPEAWEAVHCHITTTVRGIGIIVDGACNVVAIGLALFLLEGHLHVAAWMTAAVLGLCVVVGLVVARVGWIARHSSLALAVIRRSALLHPLACFRSLKLLACEPQVAVTVQQSRLREAAAVRTEVKLAALQLGLLIPSLVVVPAMAFYRLAVAPHHGHDAHDALFAGSIVGTGTAAGGLGDVFGGDDHQLTSAKVFTSVALIHLLCARAAWAAEAVQWWSDVRGVWRKGVVGLLTTACNNDAPRRGGGGGAGARVGDAGEVKAGEERGVYEVVSGSASDAKGRPLARVEDVHAHACVGRAVAHHEPCPPGASVGVDVGKGVGVGVGVGKGKGADADEGKSSPHPALGDTSVHGASLRVDRHDAVFIVAPRPNSGLSTLLRAIAFPPAHPAPLASSSYPSFSSSQSSHPLSKARALHASPAPTYPHNAHCFGLPGCWPVHLTRGRVRVCGSVVLCPATPPLLTGHSLRANVVLDKGFDSAWWAKCVRWAGLESLVEMLPSHEHTPVCVAAPPVAFSFPSSPSPSHSPSPLFSPSSGAREGVADADATPREQGKGNHHAATPPPPPPRCDLDWSGEGWEGGAGHTLSPQDLAKLSLARAMYHMADLVVVDGALDVLGEAEARRLLASWFEQGRCVFAGGLVVGTALRWPLCEDLREWHARVLVMEDGRLRDPAPRPVAEEGRGPQGADGKEGEERGGKAPAQPQAQEVQAREVSAGQGASHKQSAFPLEPPPFRNSNASSPSSGRGRASAPRSPRNSGAVLLAPAPAHGSPGAPRDRLSSRSSAPVGTPRPGSAPDAAPEPAPGSLRSLCDAVGHVWCVVVLLLAVGTAFAYALGEVFLAQGAERDGGVDDDAVWRIASLHVLSLVVGVVLVVVVVGRASAVATCLVLSASQAALASAFGEPSSAPLAGLPPRSLVVAGHVFARHVREADWGVAWNLVVLVWHGMLMLGLSGVACFVTPYTSFLLPFAATVVARAHVLWERGNRDLSSVLFACTHACALALAQPKSPPLPSPVPSLAIASKEALEAHTYARVLSAAVDGWMRVRVGVMGTVVVLMVALASAFAPMRTSGTQGGCVGLALVCVVAVTRVAERVVGCSAGLGLGLSARGKIGQFAALSCQPTPCALSTPLPPAPPPSPSSPPPLLAVRSLCTSSPRLHLPSLVVPLKRCVGVVGTDASSAGGQWAVAPAVCRLVEASVGSVVVDGVDVGHWEAQALRETVCVVPKSPVLFGPNLRTFLDPHHRLPADRLISTLQQCGLTPTFRGLYAPMSLSPPLSPLEAQQACLAKGLLSGARLFVLEELACAPSVGSVFVNTALPQVLESGAGVLVVATRVASVRACASVVVVDSGEVKESGPPAVLLSDKASMLGAMAAREDGDERAVPYP